MKFTNFLTLLISIYVYNCSSADSGNQSSSKPNSINWSVYLGKMNWFEAKSKCKSMGMRLPTLDDMREAEKSNITTSWKEDSNLFWTADESETESDKAYVHYIVVGFPMTYNKKDIYHLRCVQWVRISTEPNFKEAFELSGIRKYDRTADTRTNPFNILLYTFHPESKKLLTGATNYRYDKTSDLLTQEWTDYEKVDTFLPNKRRRYQMKRKGKYSDEFKKQAVERTLGGSYTIKEVSESLGISYYALKEWRKEFLKNADNNKPITDKEILEKEELKRLRKENLRLKEDNAILKKFAAILSRERELD